MTQPKPTQRRFSLANLSNNQLAILLFVFLMFCYSFVHQRPGWNQNSRLDLLHALFVHGTFKIDAYHENTGDKSVHNGHYYSDKAPGIVFIALPAFALSAGLLHLIDIPLDSEKGWLISDWITTAGSVGLVTALGGAAMFLFLCRLVERRYAFLTTYVVFLGSLPFPYATMLFSHAAVIGFICIALWAIADDFFMQRMIRQGISLSASDGERAGVRSSESVSLSTLGGEGWGEVASTLNRSSIKRHILAGLCCGLAIASEYPTATAAGGVLTLALLTNFKRGLILALAAIPPLLLIPLYNWTCFGGPLSFGYHHLALTEFQEMNKGLFGITWPPKLSSAYLILLSPARGLFFWTPFFLMAFLGFKSLIKRSPKLAYVSLVVILVHTIAISGYYMPDGGAALGPRHLAPMLPFLLPASAIALTPYSRTGLSLGYFSIVLTGFASLITAMPGSNYRNPLQDVFLFHLLWEKTAHNGLLALGLPVYWSLGLCSIFLLAVYFGVMETLGKPKKHSSSNF